MRDSVDQKLQDAAFEFHDRRELRIFCSTGAAGIPSRLMDLFSEFADCSVTDIASLQSIQTRRSAEMGMIAIYIDDDLDLAEVEHEVHRLRDAGTHVSVIGIAASCSVAGKTSMGRCYDALVSLEWASAETIIKRFVDTHRTGVQNRAFRAFLDHSVDGYWIWHVEQDIIEWSERTREMTKSSVSDVPHTMPAFAEMIHPLDRDRVEQAVRNHLFHGAPYKNIEMRLRQGDGKHGDFIANGQALRNEKGQAIILVGSLTDRTLMQRVEKQLEDTQRRFTVLFHHMNDAAVLADIETGLILEANQPAERLWGKTVAELVGSHQSQLHPPNLSDAAKKAFVDHISALMKNKRDSIHVPVLHADGREIPAEISSSLIEIDGKLTILGVFRDISERVKAERDLRERDAQIQLSSHLASMGTLAAGVAHEINNPLTYVLGNLELLQSQLTERGINDSDIRETVEAATTGGNYVKEIVTDLKAISRMDSNDASCNPCEVIRIASRMAMSDLRHRAQLDLDLSPVPSVPLSSARLSQVILNILSNAARSFQTSDRARNKIRVLVTQESMNVRIVITDNGRGISAEDLQKVWEPFFTKNGTSGGTGLGLAICRRILQESSGTLEINSSLNVGTEVLITLPISQKAISQSNIDDANTPAVHPAKLRLLIVDDEPLITTLMSKMLKADYDVTVRNDATQALQEIEAGAHYDLIVCDIMMPEMDGRTFYEQCPRKIPFLFVTGGAVTDENSSFERMMLSQGRLMHKPFEGSQLRKRVAAMVAAEPKHEQQLEVKSSNFVETLDLDHDIHEEVKDLLGVDGALKHYKILSDQICNLLENLPAQSAREQAAESHRVAGACDALGVRKIAKLLRELQKASLAEDSARISNRRKDIGDLVKDLREWISAS